MTKQHWSKAGFAAIKLLYFLQQLWCRFYREQLAICQLHKKALRYQSVEFCTKTAGHVDLRFAVVSCRCNRCDSNGYLQIYTDGGHGEGHQLCGSHASPNTFTTTNPRLLLIFDAHGQTAGRGFSADYQFITGQSRPFRDDVYHVYSSKYYTIILIDMVQSSWCAASDKGESYPLFCLQCM